MDASRIERINALARKAKTEGLTEAEAAEREALRKAYLAEFRAGLRQRLDSTYVQTQDGTKMPYKEYVRLAKEAKEKES